MFVSGLENHHTRIRNAGDDELSSSVSLSTEPKIITNFNCDPETANNKFQRQVLRSDSHIREAFETYLSDGAPNWLGKLVPLDMINSIFQYLPCPLSDSTKDQREDFDLKAAALRKWPE